MIFLKHLLSYGIRRTSFFFSTEKKTIFMGGRWGETLFVYLPSGTEKGCEELGNCCAGAYQ
jgi:hypothetical protein